MERDRPSGGTEPPPVSTPPTGLITSVTCPGCGVAVAVGYPKCPKCHTPVPQPRRSKRATAREEMLSGGTSVEPDASGGYGGLLAVAALVAVGIAVMVVLMTRGDDRPSGGAADEASEPAAADDDDDDGVAGEGDDDDEAAEPPRPPPADSPLKDSLKALDAALRAERVWSKVGVDGNAVVIESALCADPSMPPILNDQLGALRAAGATAIRCQEPHGAVVFTTDL